MRIAQVTYSYLPVLGGADVYAAQLYRLFDHAGFEQRVYQRHTVTDDQQVVPLPRLPGSLAAKEFWLLPGMLPFYLLSLMKDDVIVVHYPNYWLPLFWHPRTIGLSHGVTWDDAPGSVGGGIKRSLARMAFRNCTAFVANDSFFLRELGLEVEPRTRFFEEVAPRKWLIPNCVDPDLFRPNDGLPNLKSHHPVLVPRNIFRNRGIHLAVEAFNAVSERHPELSLVIAGEFSQPAYAREVADLIRRLDLLGKVLFIGGVPHHEMPEVYGSSLLTVIPSLCGEGTSLAALESMSCGTPCVTTNIAGLADLPTLQCEPTAEALAQAMLHALSGRDALGREQHERVLHDFGYQRWQDSWLKVVESVKP